jgi:hypothetical protein
MKFDAISFIIVANANIRIVCFPSGFMSFKPSAPLLADNFYLLQKHETIYDHFIQLSQVTKN